MTTQSDLIRDKVGNCINMGDIVARAVLFCNSPKLEICTVTSIMDGKVYLDHSPRAIVFTDRLVILSRE